MKLRKLDGVKGPGYPTFADYHRNRERYLGGRLRGTGALLLAGVLTGCDKSAAEGAGTGPAVGKPVAQVEAKLLGEAMAPAAPRQVEVVPIDARNVRAVEPRVALGGIVAAPAPPPVPAPAPDTEPKPAPVEPVKVDPPKLPGKPGAPVKPEAVEPEAVKPEIGKLTVPAAVRGRIAAPAVPVLPKQPMLAKPVELEGDVAMPEPPRLDGVPPAPEAPGKDEAPAKQ